MNAVRIWLFRLVLILVAGISGGCQKFVGSVPYPDPVPVEGHARILVLSPEAEATRTVIHTLRDELSEDFDVYVRTVDPPETTSKDVERLMTKLRPAAVVLLDNPTVGLYRDWSTRAEKTLPVAVILMASFAAELQKSVPNSIAIPYEVPSVNAFAEARTIFSPPFEKVGVVYRSQFSGYVQKQADLAKVEGFELLRAVVPEEPTVEDLRRALEQLKREGIEALWVLNDNALLTTALTTRGWLPFSKHFRGPIVVGVPSLVEAPASFGTFAAIPDAEALGVQAADLVYDLRDRNFELDRRVELPQSAHVFVNGERGRRVGFETNHLDYVDVLVE